MATYGDFAQHRSRRFVGLALRTLCALLFWCVASGSHAASVYKCVGAEGRVTFRDTPCAPHARQTKLDLTGQPLIDPGAPRPTSSRQTSPRAHSRQPHAHARARSRKQPPVSWKCRAADGEVFYRHTRCPSSVPGDGVVRNRYAERNAREYPRRHQNAWSRVRVRGKKIPRTEACRAIHSPAAAGRDGHLRDANVSTYARLTGHDPCDSAQDLP